MAKQIFMDPSLNAAPEQSRIFIDDNCTYIAALHNNQHHVNISMINWQYHCEKITREVHISRKKPVAQDTKAMA